jgi:hypothetical protein
MSIENKYKEMWETGFPMFEKLFNLNKPNLLKVLKELFQDNESILEILENNPNVIKKIENDVPNEIKVCFYSYIEINPFGIYYQPEHGASKQILKFFNIDAVLKIID